MTQVYICQLAKEDHESPSQREITSHEVEQTNRKVTAMSLVSIMCLDSKTLQC